MDGGSPRLKFDLNKKNSEASSLNDRRPNSHLSGDHQTHRAQNTQTHENPSMQGENGTSSVPKQNKSRRIWTAQLHLHFLEAVGFLGGAQVASPKRIKQAMKVEGLTDNEIKSHLQTYRKKLAKDKKREIEEEDNIWENGLHSELDQDIDDCCSTNGK